MVVWPSAKERLEEGVGGDGEKGSGGAKWRHLNVNITGMCSLQHAAELRGKTGRTAPSEGEMKNHPAWPLPLATVHLTAPAHRCYCLCVCFVCTHASLFTKSVSKKCLPKHDWYFCVIYCVTCGRGYYIKEPDSMCSTASYSALFSWKMDFDSQRSFPLKARLDFLFKEQLPIRGSWIFFCVGGCGPLSGRVFFPLSQRRLVVRGLLYSVKVVTALSLTVEGGGGESQIVYYGMMVGGWGWCTVGKSILGFHLFLNQRVINMKLHQIIIQVMDVCNHLCCSVSVVAWVIIVAVYLYLIFLFF